MAYVRSFKVKRGSRTYGDYHQLVYSVRNGKNVKQVYIHYIPKGQKVSVEFGKIKVGNIHLLEKKLKRIKASHFLTTNEKLERVIDTREHLDQIFEGLHFVKSLTKEKKLKTLIDKINKTKFDIKKLKTENARELRKLKLKFEKTKREKIKEIERRKEYRRCYSLKSELKKYPKYHTTGLKLVYGLTPNKEHFKEKKLFNGVVIKEKVIYVPPLYKYPEKLKEKYVEWFSRYRKDFALHQKKKALPRAIGHNVFNNYMSKKTKREYVKLFKAKGKIVEKFEKDYAKWLNGKTTGKRERFFKGLRYGN